MQTLSDLDEKTQRVVDRLWLMRENKKKVDELLNDSKPYTLQHVADEVKLSKSRVHQIDEEYVKPHERPSD